MVKESLQPSERRPTQQLGTDAVPAEQWRHFHKVTPLSKAGALWVVVAYVVYQFATSIFQENIERGGELPDELVGAAQHYALIGVAIAAGLLLLVTAIVLVFAYIAWKCEEFALAESGIHYRSGIIFKQHTQMRWDRVQSVEVQQKLFGRIFGFGSVKVESAGNDDDIELGLLRLVDCSRLRTEILNTVAQVRSGGLMPEAGAPASPLAPPSQSSAGSPELTPNLQSVEPFVADADDLERDTLIYQLPTGRLIAANLLGGKLMGGIILVILVLVGMIVSRAASGESLSVTAIGIVVVVAGTIWGLLKSLFADYGTKLFVAPAGLRKRAGLTKLTTSTYPPQRIHAVRITRPLLWRRLDWWKIDIAKAGAVSTSNNTEELTRVFMPVATREEMLRILWVIMPGFGSGEDAAVLAEAFDGQGSGRWFMGAPKRARWLDPIGLHGHGVALTPRAIFLRRRRFGRVVDIVPHDRIQSVRIEHGPLQRAAQVASLAVDLVPGISGWCAAHLEQGQAWELLQREAALARASRAK